MVNEKSKHLLAEVYRGRLDGDIGDTAAFSDVYTMKRMSKENPGKMASATAAPAPFEFVSESNMDFENYKNRPEFSDEHGGEGSVYGGAASSIHRPDTPSSHWGGKDRGRSASRDSERTFGGAGSDEPGVLYPAGYHQTPSALREYSPSPERGMLHRLDSTESPYEIHDDDGRRNLVHGAAPMGATTTTVTGAAPEPPAPGGQYTPYSPSRDGAQQRDYFAR